MYLWHQMVVGFFFLHLNSYSHEHYYLRFMPSFVSNQFIWRLDALIYCGYLWQEKKISLVFPCEYFCLLKCFVIVLNSQLDSFVKSPLNTLLIYSLQFTQRNPIFRFHSVSLHILRGLLRCSFNFNRFFSFLLASPNRLP